MMSSKKTKAPEAADTYKSNALSPIPITIINPICLRYPEVPLLN